MHTVKMALTRCPACDYPLDAISNMTGSKMPAAGDLTVCIGCANPMRFTTGLGVESIPMSAVPSYLWPTIDSIRIGIQMMRSAKA